MSEATRVVSPGWWGGAEGAGDAMSTDAVVATRGLTKRFGPVTAVADLDLEVRQSEIYAFLGRNGAGKPRPSG
jgi:ABC-type uncharacterized transport system ATPase subunit